MKWFISTVVLGAITAWLTGIPSRFFPVPPPARVRLALRNPWRNLEHPEDTFCIVLCWLENDKTGDDTRHVETAFAGIEGIRLIRSARIVTASGAADEWRPTMQQRASTVLADWNADLVIVGMVKKAAETLNLWFVPRSGDGTLDRGDRPYKLENVTLGADFHEDLRVQLSATAMAAVAPLADTEARGRVLKKGLRHAVEKLSNLLKGATIRKPEHRAALHATLGNALFALGKRETGTGRLQQAVDAYQAALEVYTVEAAAVDYAMTQTNLGNVLRSLGERKTGTEHLKQAVAAHRAALKVYTLESTPFYWAAAQNNLANALMGLGERETEAEYLEQAAAAYHAALKVFTLESTPLDWAMTQNNLGGVLTRLGERETGTKRLKQAVVAYHAALKVYTLESTPLDWAMTQNNLGSALSALGERKEQTGTEYLKQAVAAHRAALEVYTPRSAPFYLAMTQFNLGNALAILGQREAETEHVEQAVDAYRAALEVLGSEGPPRYRDMVETNLRKALQR